MSVRHFVWGNTPYYKIEEHVPVMSTDVADGGSGIPDTRARAKNFALSSLAFHLAPDYEYPGSEIWTPEDLELVEEDTGAMAQATGFYNVTYRVLKSAADAAVLQDYVVNNQSRPASTPEPADDDSAPSNPGPSGELEGKDYKITDLGGGNYQIEVGWPMGTTAVARRVDQDRAQLFASGQLALHVNQQTPYDGETQCAALSGMTKVFSNWNNGNPPDDYLIEIYQASAVATDCPDAAADPASEDPSETGPAGDTSQDTPATAPLGAGDANPDAPPGVEERDGNYVITAIVPEGEDPKDVAETELAKYMTDSSRARAGNIGIDGTLTELSSGPAPGGVGGKKILIMGDSQWDGTSMGRAVKESLEAQGAEVRTLWKYGKGAAVGASHFGVSVTNSSGNTTVSPTGLLGSMLTSFQPNIVIIGLGGNDSYGWNNKKEKYKKVLEGWITAFQAAGVSEVRWFGPSFATNNMSNGRSYDTIRQKIRGHQQEYLSSSPVSGIQTTWTDTVPLTRDLERKDDGVHFVSGPTGYGGWGTLMTSASGPLADLVSDTSGATRVQFAVPIANVRVTSQPPKGEGPSYREGLNKAPPSDQEKDKANETAVEVNIEPIDFQCILLQNIRQLAAKHESVPYDHAVRLTADGNPGNVMSIINHGNMTDEVRELLSLCPEIYAALSPYLKITRIEYDDKGKVKKDSTGRPVEKELRIPNFISPHDVDDILAGTKNRTSGAGVKSFSWELKGVQPAEVDNNITANLQIYFQSVGDFFGGATQAGGNVPNFLDLIINSPAVRKVKDKAGTSGQSPSSKPKGGTCPINKAISDSYDGANFRIKVCAGWAAPEDMESMFPTIPPAKIKLLRAAVMASRASLFLQQVRHNITFNENGSLLLSIDYHAALSGLLRGSTADIFGAGKNKDDIERMRSDKKEFERTSKDPDASDSEKEEAKEEIDALLESIDELEQADKLQKYRKLLDGLFTSDKIKILEMPGETVFTKNLSAMDPEARAEEARTRSAPNYIDEFIKDGDFDSQVLDSIPKEGGEVEDVGEDIAKAQKKKSKKDTKKIKKNKMIQIPYMYLGDLIDNVINQMALNNAEALNFLFFISEVELVDPLVAFQVKDFADYAACGSVKDDLVLNAMEASSGVSMRGRSGLLATVNIGDIPISLDAFQKWFTDKVIKKSLDRYYFLNFIKDISAQLISNSLKSRCYGKRYKFFQRFDAQPVSLADNKELKTKTRISAKSLAGHKSKLTCESSAADTGLGVVLMSTDTKPSSLRGDFEQDLRNGIYHNYIGSSCGLVKRMNFNREDQPYLRESKIQKEGALGAAQLRELYSVSVDLVGNNLYRNGSYIYVSPLLLDTTMEELEFLGLHGYYLVTDVKSEITEASFNTSIRALHEGVKFPDNGSGDSESTPPPPEPSAPPNAKSKEEKEKKDIPWIPFI